MFLIQFKKDDVEKVKKALKGTASFLGTKAGNVVASASKSQEVKELEFKIRLRELELEILKEQHKK